MGDEQKWADDLEAAWVRFRRRLADRLGELESGDPLLIGVEVGVETDELEGASPYLQVIVGDAGRIRAEAVSNNFLDQRYQLGGDDEDHLVELGWERPGSSSPNFALTVERREVDRLAVLAVDTLRQVFAVPHPIFLDAEGLEVDPQDSVGAAEPTTWDVDDEPLAVLVRDRDELQAQVDAALAPMLGGHLRHDEDGDIPILAGRSMLFVHVGDERPDVELFAVLVREATDTARLAVELDILNRSQTFARIYQRGGTVHLVHEICAVPFAPRQLRAVVADLLGRIDDLAGDLVSRVGGLTWMEPSPTPEPSVVSPRRDDAHPGIVMLLELLHTGPVSPRAVADLFDGDRLELIRQLVRIRTGQQDCDEHDEEAVLHHLRRGLRFVVDGGSVERPGRGVRRDRQLSLLSDDEVGEPSLDLGLSG